MSKEKIALFTIFGGTGDLAKRKLYPSLYRLYKKGFLAEKFAVIGTARREWTDEYYRDIVMDSINGLAESYEHAAEFASHFYYQSHNVTDIEHYSTLKKLTETLDEKYQLEGNRLFYLAMSPNFFGIISQNLKDGLLLTDSGFNRLIIEKPFGHNYSSALELNEQIRASFAEDQIYRIDHYLGKEMVQNISAVRFANNMFESMWNNRYIDNIQITLSESLGVEERGGYYDTSGALRDMLQNHILQMVSLLAMEPPTRLHDKEIRAEKIKALQAVRLFKPEDVPHYLVRGQYGRSTVNGEHFEGYREELNVAPDSQTETFVAGKIMIDNFRWSGVPFYFRTGKRLAEKGTQIDIEFKNVPLNLFNDNSDEPLPPNVLTIYIQPTEGFSLELNTKKVGLGLETETLKLEQKHSAETTANSPEAYEKLILDCLNGDSTNFTHWDEVASSWKFVDIIRQAWDNETIDFPNYPSGSMGPIESDLLLTKDGFQWHWCPTKE
ncbi:MULTISPECIES: glucose-6-phosphate dehydrogenase [Carnobacterium]|uniref:Glucose-6-phosphate 1-dehydrogenase n=1 Tax=Carnobacterium antarcticum TaxID=2126436 RepID=A0ABW4NPZ4_9LACT|nr:MULTISPECIES: glucose-6-phosphate dehydrogenase [unclassified Carnobacterium]ALV21316.1 Glucose-6-phosphate 1-dehydrogenase [Carnobacterium sp. CP1]QQP69339.1 glucose-6-phosphate dehydrogenase [Carnobacterium sp. CS13]